MSTLLLSLSAITFYASSKHFAGKLPNWITSMPNKSKLLIILGYCTLIIGTLIEITQFGISTGVVIAFFTFTLLASLYILFVPMHKNSLIVILLISVIITLIRIYTFYYAS